MLGALLALAALGCAGAAKDLEFVEEVGPANYDNFLLSASEEKQWVLLEFYAPWCDHCKAMAPILDESAMRRPSKRRARGLGGERMGFAGKHPGVRVAKIDATRNKQLAKDHRIEGYPTLRWRGVGAHKFREYKGGRDLESLDRIDARLNAPIISAISNKAEFEGMASLAPGVAFVALKDWLTPEELSILPAFSFEAVAVERHHEASFAVAPSAVFGRGVEAASSGVAVLEPGEPPMYFDLAVVGEPAAAEAAAAGGPRLSKRGLNAWVKRHNAKLYTALGPRNFRALGRERSVATAIMPSSDQGSEFVGLSKELQAAARGAEAAVRDKMGFGELDGYRWKAFVATMGVREAQLPRLLVIDVDGDRYWARDAASQALVADSDLSAAEIADFLGGISSGAIRPHYHGVRGFFDRARRLAEEHPAVFAAMIVMAILILSAFAMLIKSWLSGGEDDRRDSVKKPKFH